MIFVPSRQIVCPRCRQPFRRRPQHRRQSIYRPRRFATRNMAAGDLLLDNEGDVMLNATDESEALDNGVDTTCCGCSGSTPSCDCGTCSSSTDPRGVHLLGFDGNGNCINAGRSGYMKITGTLDFSDNVPLHFYQPVDPSNPFCSISWQAIYGFTIPAGTLRAYYFSDPFCLNPTIVGGGSNNVPVYLENVFFGYGCGAPLTNPVDGSAWSYGFNLTDRHFFNVQIQGAIASPGTCEAATTLHYDPASQPGQNIFEAGDVLVAAA